MPRRKTTLSIEERNALEREAIYQGRLKVADMPERVRGTALTMFVEGFMTGARLTPDERQKAIETNTSGFLKAMDTVHPTTRKRAAKVAEQTSIPGAE